MIHSGRAVLVDCGKCNQISRLQLTEEVTNEEIVLLIFDSACSVRINNALHQVRPFTFMLHPFEHGTLQIQLQKNTVFSWLHLRITDAFRHELKESGLAFRMEHFAMQPLAIADVYKIVASMKEVHTALEQEIAERSMELLLCLLLQNVHHSERAVHVPHYEKLAQLRSEIYLHPEEDWFIQDICDRLCISRPYFHKIYLMAFGISCTQDVIESRIAYAKRLLESTGDAISLISQKSGFESDVYFMRQFKRHTGMTPTAYRRICRQSGPSMDPKRSYDDL